MPTFRARQWQVREDAILDAARDLLSAESYGDMSMDDVANRVGVSKATLYQHFASKDELATHVVVRSMQRGLDEIAGQDPSLPAIARLEHALRQGLRRKAAIWAARTTVPATIAQHPMYQAQRQRMIAALATLVDEGEAQGDIRADLPTLAIVEALLSLYRMAVGEILGDCGYAPDEISRFLVSLALDGLRQRSEPASTAAAR